MQGWDPTNFVPLALYGDEAEYSITKEKILVLYISNFAIHLNLVLGLFFCAVYNALNIAGVMLP